MIQLNLKQQATTFLNLLDTWNVPDKLKTSEDVKQHTAAEITAYHQPIAFHCQYVAGLLARAKQQQAETAKQSHWSVDFDDLTDRIGSATVARLALGLLGMWQVWCNELEQSEWSDAGTVGGPRNQLVLPDNMLRLRQN